MLYRRFLLILGVALSVFTAPRASQAARWSPVEAAQKCWRQLVGESPAESRVVSDATASVSALPVMQQAVLPAVHRAGPYREFVRAPEEVRFSRGADGDVRFVRDHSNPILGEAWRTDTGDAKQDRTWGDIVRNDDGSIRRMNYDDAVEYCVGLNPEYLRDEIRAALKAGHVPERGIYLPLREDFVRLRRQMGATSEDSAESAPGYQPQVLPNIGHWFRSSSVLVPTVYVFYGDVGGIGYSFRSLSDDDDYYYYIAVRCVRSTIP